MHYVEIPSDEEVIQALSSLDGHATASALCGALVDANHPRRDSQLAIQRAVDRGWIVVGSDWMLSLAEEVVAA